jgi:hypothetical protein
MSKKTFSISVPAQAFLSEEAKTTPNPEEEKKLLEFFGVNDINDSITLSTKLEAVLWQAFLKVKGPLSPLKMKAHEKYLDGMAAKLNETIDKDDLPALSKEDLDKIRPFFEDEQEFEKFEIPFEARADEEGKEAKAIPLPALNLFRDMLFIETLIKVFSNESVE